MDGIAAVRGCGGAEIGGETEAGGENRRTGEAGAQKGLPAPAGGARTMPVGERSQERAGCGEGRIGYVRSRPHAQVFTDAKTSRRFALGPARPSPFSALTSKCKETTSHRSTPILRRKSARSG